MRELTMFYLESCPYCQKARAYMRELCAENSAYAALSIKMVEERQESELANRYDYYYVPCYFIEQNKIAEGGIDKEGVRKVFDMAIESAPAAAPGLL